MTHETLLLKAGDVFKTALGLSAKEYGYFVQNIPEEVLGSAVGLFLHFATQRPDGADTLKEIAEAWRNRQATGKGGLV